MSILTWQLLKFFSNSVQQQKENDYLSLTGICKYFWKNPCRRNSFDKILSENCHVDELSFRQKFVDKILSTNYCRQKFVDESDCRQKFVDESDCRQNFVDQWYDYRSNKNRMYSSPFNLGTVSIYCGKFFLKKRAFVFFKRVLYRFFSKYFWIQ